MASWIDQTAERLRSEETQKVSGLEEHRLRKALSPQVFGELRDWMKENAEELNKRVNIQVLAFEVTPISRAKVTRLKVGKPVARLTVEFDEQAQRVRYSCGAGRGEYLFGVSLSDASVYFQDVYRRPFTVEEVGAFLFDKLMNSPF
jgi:hypothetical protein